MAAFANKYHFRGGEEYFSSQFSEIHDFGPGELKVDEEPVAELRVPTSVVRAMAEQLGEWLRAADEQRRNPQ